jgi:4-amino-4-deoxy-L-arabinose transferase-like glycosyltransferase
MKTLLNTTRKTLADYWFLFLISLACFAVHMVANANYGFHRDELQFIADSRHLAGGFVAYPPVTAAAAALARTLFGESLVAYRVFSGLAHAVILFVAGLIAFDLGGKRFAAALSAVACASSPVLSFSGSVIMYMIYDSLCWTLAAYFLIRVLKGDTKQWIGVGVSAGFGMMSKYSIAFLVVCMAFAFLVLPERKRFFNRYFLAGAALGLVIFSPNLVWLVRHDFVTYDFLKYIHARDIKWGRAEGFLGDQLSDCIGYAAVPLALAGAWFLSTRRELARFRAIPIWTAAVVVLFAVMKGRGYYTAALYVPLVAAGSVFVGRMAEEGRLRQFGRNAIMGFFVVSAIVTAAITIPLAPVGSPWFRVLISLNDGFTEQFGWEELAFDVAGVRESLPEGERPEFGILAGNYGEAGALEFYGRKYGLPKVMCGTNSFYDRGYDENEPSVIVAIGFDRAFLSRFFGSVEVVAHARNAYGFANEETSWHKEIFLCRKPNFTWNEFWKRHRSFG